MILQNTVAHLALYRKYRSQSFGELNGQEHVVRTLQNSITQSKIAHAYLFTGPRGTGKTSTARLLAKALNCENGPSPEPCNQCEICKSITEGSCIDVLEMDAASESGVEDVREKIVQVTEYKPNYCRYKIFIIDEVHDLSLKAFDALLKTIEEPPEHVVFILATTEYNKVPPTIRSRCVKFEFHRATMRELVEQLTIVCDAEGLGFEPAALSAIARLADGGYRDALTLLEQVVMVGDGDITLATVTNQLGLIENEALDDLLIAISDREIAKVLNSLEEIGRKGRDPRHVVEALVTRLADLSRASFGIDVGTSPDATIEAAAKSTAGRIGPDNMTRIRQGLVESHKHVREVSIPRIWLEQQILLMAVEPPPAPVAKLQPATQPSSSAVARPQPPVAKQPVKPVPKAAVRKISVEKTGDPIFDQAQDAWAATVEELSKISEIARNRIMLTAIVEIKGQLAQVGFARNTDLEWLQDRPKQQGVLHEMFGNHIGAPGWKLEFIVSKALAQPTDAAQDSGVERSMEGPALQEAGREIFEGL